MPNPDSTLEGITARRGGFLSRLASRTFVVLVLLTCIGGATGLLGGHTSTAAETRDGYRLTLSYPGTARPGLDTFWELTVEHPGGFNGPITIAVTGTYFDLFETQGFYPTPSDSTRDDTYVYMEFTPPPHGDTFTMMYDAYIQPYVAPTNLLAQDATVALVNHDKRVVTVDFATWMFP
ncbi:MAG: hypothetical protein WKF54_01625 [Nocardioidaceae bacterium]